MNDKPVTGLVNTSAVFGRWGSADQLGAGDKIVFVTENGTIVGRNGGKVQANGYLGYSTGNGGEYVIKTDQTGWALKWNPGNSGFLRSYRRDFSDCGMWKYKNLDYDGWNSNDILIGTMSEHSAILISQGLA